MGMRFAAPARMRLLLLLAVAVLAWIPAVAADKAQKTAKAEDKASIDNYFRALDLNGDGYVSLAEAAGDPVIVKRFDKADRNRDGKLSEKEFGNLSKVKVRVAKAKSKDKDISAAVGGSASQRRRVQQAAE